MNRILLIVAVCVLSVGFAAAQNWTPVWKMTEVPYLTRPDVDNMAFVKAGFDTDQDGWGEFICTWTDEDTNVVLMYEATADNTYELVWSWIYPVSGWSYAGIAVGDVNNNGIVDIITSRGTYLTEGINPPRIWFFEWNGVVGENNYGNFNSGTGTFDPSESWNLDAPDNYELRPYSLIVEDIDGDNINELVVGVRQVTGTSDRQVIVASIQGDFGGFIFYDVEWRYTGQHGGSNYSTTTGDLDNDGNKEIYAFIWNYFSMRIFECTGDKQFTEAFAVDTLYRYGGTGFDYGALDAVRVVDADNNGSPEMYIATTENPNELYVVSGVSDVSTMTSADIKRFYTIPVNVDGGFRSMYVADPDHDGNVDLMIGGEADGRIYSLEYSGSGDPADSANWNLQTIFNVWDQGAPVGLTPRFFYGHPASDMDKDGKDEYVFVNYSPDYTTWPDDVPLWVIEIDVVSDVRDEAAGIPEDFELLQNYPNPFNPTTTIPYRLASRAHVRLDVFNVYGQHITSIVNAEREPGYYQATWKADVPSGTYFYRISVEPLDGSKTAFQDVKKMVLVR